MDIHKEISKKDAIKIIEDEIKHHKNLHPERHCDIPFGDIIDKIKKYE